MIKLYCIKAPIPELKGVIRDIRPTWALEELKLPYELQWRTVEELKSDTYRAIHPFGAVPAIQDGDLTLFESAQIVTYLCEKAGKLIPKAGTKERHLHDQWIFVAMANLDFDVNKVFFCEVFEKTEDSKKELAKVLEGMGHYLQLLDKWLTPRPYLTGSEFAAADLVMSCTLRFLKEKNHLDAFPSLKKYVEKNWERPAALRAFEINGNI
jgi:glutathione S-transferase